MSTGASAAATSAITNTPGATRSHGRASSAKSTVSNAVNPTGDRSRADALAQVGVRQLLDGGAFDARVLGEERGTTTVHVGDAIRIDHRTDHVGGARREERDRVVALVHEEHEGGPRRRASDHVVRGRDLRDLAVLR